MLKRFLSLIIVICITCGMFLSDFSVFNSLTASAYIEYTYLQDKACYYIEHVGSGKFLDVADESLKNGAKLQIWDRTPRHQNQVFRFEKVGMYWKIVPNHSGKYIQVEKASKKNYVSITQCDIEHSWFLLQLWKIIENSDGTVSFQSVYSGKYLDVCGNCSDNGTPVIQYTRNTSRAQRFKVYGCTRNDVLNASWQRSLPQWYLSRNLYQELLVRIDYYDFQTVKELVAEHNYYPTFMNSVFLGDSIDVLGGAALEASATYIAALAGLKTLPGIGVAVGMMYSLAQSQSKTDWNRFVDMSNNISAKSKTQSGIIVYTYGTVEYDQSKRYSSPYYIGHIRHSYEYWNGNFVEPQLPYSGDFNYSFKNALKNPDK